MTRRSALVGYEQLAEALVASAEPDLVVLRASDARPQPMRPRGRPPGSHDRRGRARRVDVSIRRTTYPALVVDMGVRLRELREEQDISAEELALSIRVSVMTVFAWERGRCAPPLHHQLALSQALGCSIADLLPERAHHR